MTRRPTGDWWLYRDPPTAAERAAHCGAWERLVNGRVVTQRHWGGLPMGWYRPVPGPWPARAGRR